MSMKRRQAGAVFITLITCVIWGFSFMFTRSVVVRIPIFSLLSWRFLIALLAFLALIALKVLKINLKGKKLFPLLKIAIAEPVVFFIAESIAIQRTSATETSLMIATIPIVAMIVGIPIAKQIPAGKQALSIILSVVGVMAVILGQSIEGISFDFIGYFFMLTAVFSGAVFSALSAKHDEYSSVEKSLAMMVVGCIVFGSAALIQNIAAGTVKEWLMLPFQDKEFLLAILYLGLLASVVCYVGQNYSIAVIGMNRSVSFSGVSTLTSVLAGVFILHEEINASMIIGGIIILAGVYGANYFTPEKEKTKESLHEKQSG